MKWISSIAIVTLGLLLGFGPLSLAVGPNILAMSVNQEFGIIDPHRGNDWTESMAMVNLYDALVFPSPAGEMEPKLAESWTISPDGLTYTFKLRKGVKFHDGSELTAEDVKFSVDRMLALNEGYSWLWADVLEEATVDNSYTVSFHLSSPFAPFISTLSWLFIVNKDAILAHKEPGKFGEFGDYGKHWLSVTTTEDAGSGPYMLKSWERGREIVFERFPDYFEGWPHGDKSVDEVHILLLKEAATVKTMLRKGELTIVEHYRTPSDYDEMASYPHIKVVKNISGEALYFKINTKLPPTDDIHIRRMLAWAFDYKSAITEIEPGSVQARGPIPCIIPGANPRVFLYHQDLDKAREEMMLSKYYPDVPDINITYVAGMEIERKMALSLKESLAKIGVNLDIHVEQWGRITDLATTIETTPNITEVFSAAAYPDPDLYLYSTYHSAASGTWMSMEWLQDPLVDQLIEQERTTLDKEERAHLLNILQHIIVERCPDIFIYTLPKRCAMQDYVKGFTYRPVMSFEYYFHDLWYEK